jgi:hypothetical protein
MDPWPEHIRMRGRSARTVGLLAATLALATAAATGLSAAPAWASTQVIFARSVDDVISC